MIPKEELEEMYWKQEMSQYEIAGNLNVSQSTVNRWMKDNGIMPRTVSESMLINPSYLPEGKLYQMYWVFGMSLSEIAVDLGISTSTVNRWMKKCGIESRTDSESKLIGDISGEKNGNWQGGISFEPYCNKFNNAFKESVRKRDDYTCQLCGYEQLSGGQRLDVHHIHYDKENCAPDVVALCRSCNSIVNGDRDYWEQYFEKQLLHRGIGS